MIVDNEPGALARISGMFSGRGYNIESLTVSETEEARHLSRITIVTTGTNAVIEQIPLKRCGTPDDVNRLIVYLLEGTNFVTGACFRVDGGRFLGED